MKGKSGKVAADIRFLPLRSPLLWSASNVDYEGAVVHRETVDRQVNDSKARK